MEWWEKKMVFHNSNIPSFQFSSFSSALSAASSEAGERKVFVFHSFSSRSPETWNFRMNFRSI